MAEKYSIKKRDFLELTSKVNYAMFSQQLNHKSQQVIILLGAFEKMGILPTYDLLNKYLSTHDKGQLSRTMTALRKEGFVLPKINKLDAKGKGVLTFLSIGIEVAPIRIHRLGLKFKVLSMTRPFKHGEFFSFGRKKNLGGYKNIIGETWKGTLYAGKNKTFVAYFSVLWGINTRQVRLQITEATSEIVAFMLGKGVELGSSEIFSEEYSLLDHPLAKWYFENFGVGKTEGLWVDQSLGIPELESNNLEVLEALEVFMTHWSELVKNGQAKLTKAGGDLMDYDDKGVDKEKS